LLERDPDRPELARRRLDFPAVGLPEREAPLRASPSLRGELLRREVELLEVLKAPPLRFFFSPKDGARTRVVATPSKPE